MGEFEIDDELLEVFALEADELIRNIGSNLEKLKKAPTDSEALLEIRRSAHTLKGSAAIIGLDKLSDFAHRVEDLLANKTNDERIFDFLTTILDSFEILPQVKDSERITKKFARINEEFDRLTTLLDEQPENNLPLAAAIDISEVTSNETTKIKISAEPFQNRSVVRVSLDKLDDLLKLTGGLGINRPLFEKQLFEFENQITELQSNSPSVAPTDNPDSIRNKFQTLFDNQQRLIEEIKNKLLRLRLVSFETLTVRLRRTVKTACEEEAKFAELFFEGENIEIDTQTLDCLTEPLLHLLRNAVAHGIEAPEVRSLLGKSERGEIFVRVSTDDSRVIVSVSDDGRGISADALKEKAVSSNFISRGEAEKMSDAQAFELVFLPGLTTAEQLSRIAGRGVGMNIVKTGIERLRGTIDIKSKPREGTTFILCLPVNPLMKQIPPIKPE